jgi:ABC-type multidrug transport system fused ATPase/permease subunit
MLRNKNIKDFFGVLALTDYKEKRSIYYFCFLLFLVSIFEVLSVGMVIPFSLVLNDSNYLQIVNNLLLEFGLPNINNLFLLQLIVLLLFLFIFVIKFFFISILSKNKNKFVYELKSRWQQRVLLGYLKKDFSFFFYQSQSNLTLKCINHIENFTQLGVLGTMEFFTEIVILFSLLLLLLFVEPTGCFFVFLICLLFYFIFDYLTKNKIKKLAISKTLNENIAYNTIKETLGGIKEVFLYKKEKYFFEKFRTAATLFSKSSYKHQTLIDSPRFLLELLAVFCFVILVFILLLTSNYNSIVITKLAVFAAVTFKLLPSLNRISVSLAKIRFANPYFLSIKKELNPSIKYSDNFFKKQNNNFNFQKYIELKNINFAYSNKIILQNINLKIKKNSIIGIEGDSGSGKSTLANIICGLLKPTKGHISVDNKIITKKNLNSWLEMIGYIPQDVFLLEGTVKDNITFFSSSNIDYNKLLEICRQANLDSFINRLPKKLNTIVYKDPSNFSGGQIQRIGIARTLYKGSELLIFDEATSALDINNQKYVLNILKRLKGKKTIIIISHHKRILSICDFIYKISNKKMSKV